MAAFGYQNYKNEEAIANVFNNNQFGLRVQINRDFETKGRLQK